MSHSYLDYGNPFMELYSFYIFFSSENEKTKHFLREKINVD